MATRSARLAYGTTSEAGDNFVFTGPAGITTIVKSIYLFNTSGETASPLLLIQDSAGIRIWFYLLPSFLEDTDTRLDPCWIVLNPGDQLDVFSEVTGLMYNVSGAYLPGTAEE